MNWIIIIISYPDEQNNDEICIVNTILRIVWVKYKHPMSKINNLKLNLYLKKKSSRN